jgi:predicted aconitase with swiveling domain
VINLPAKVVIDGACDAPALVTREPINFTAALCKLPNLWPSKRGVSQDEHHELFGQDLTGKALVFPSCIGSTYTGLVLLELVRSERGPAALVVQKADPLLVSGVILSEVWYETSIPVFEHPGGDLFDAIHTGDHVEIKPGRDKICIQHHEPVTRGSANQTGGLGHPE